MSDKRYIRNLLRELFEEEALIISGLVATMEVHDEFVWRLMKNLDRLREQVFARVEEIECRIPSTSAPKSAPHPAIEDFLDRLSHGDCCEPQPHTSERTP
jgi:hypothetical protein